MTETNKPSDDKSPPSLTDKKIEIGKKITVIDKGIDVAKKTGISEKISEKIAPKL